MNVNLFPGWESLILHDIMPVFGEATTWSDATGLPIETPEAFTSQAIHYASRGLPRSLRACFTNPGSFTRRRIPFNFAPV